MSTDPNTPQPDQPKPPDPAPEPDQKPVDPNPIHPRRANRSHLVSPHPRHDVWSAMGFLTIRRGFTLSHDRPRAPITAPQPGAWGANRGAPRRCTGPPCIDFACRGAPRAPRSRKAPHASAQRDCT
jgi:hypothetical protein